MALNNEDDTAAKLAGYTLKIKLKDGEILYTKYSGSLEQNSPITKIIMFSFDVRNNVDAHGVIIPGSAKIPFEKFIPIENGLVMFDQIMYVREL